MFGGYQTNVSQRVSGMSLMRYLASRTRQVKLHVLHTIGWRMGRDPIVLRRQFSLETSCLVVFWCSRSYIAYQYAT